MSEDEKKETVAEEAPADESAAKEEAPKAEEAPKNDAKEKGGFQKKVESFFNTNDSTNDCDAADIEKNKVFAILAYFGILVLVPIFAAKDSKFAKFHANQGLVFLIAALVVNIPLALLGLIPYVGIIFTIIDILLGLVFVVYFIFGIVNAANGKAKELPIIGKIKILK